MTHAINGIFELFGAAMLSMHCFKLLKDKQIKGVAVTPFVFFTLWGYWNLIYYPSVGDWLSFLGGLAVVAVNTWYLYLLWYYKA